MSEIEVRVGDRERTAVDEQLRDAVGDGVLTLAEYDERAAALWRARTRRELDALVADLPAAAPRPAPRPAAAPAVRTAPQRVVAVMSEDRLSGALTPGSTVTGWAVMGKAVLDLRREDLPDGVHVRVRSVMGEVEVQVPPGSQVVLSGLAVMGERKVSVAPGDGPVVHVDAYAVMGEVKVTVGDGAVVPRQTGGARAVAPVPPAAPAPRRHGGRLTGGLLALALAGGALVGAGQVVAAGDDARAVFGSAVERVPAPRDGDVVEVSVLFGSVEVVVPDGVRVDLDGGPVFGSSACAAACGSGQQGPAITVRAVGGFGSVEVVTESEAATD